MLRQTLLGIFASIERSQTKISVCGHGERVGALASLIGQVGKKSSKRSLRDFLNKTLLKEELF